MPQNEYLALLLGNSKSTLSINRLLK